MKTKTITSKIKKYNYLLLICCFFNTALYAQNWTQIASGTSKKLNTICFTSSTIGYIGGNDSLLMKTTDGGATWSNLNFTGITFYPGEGITNMQFLSDSVGFVNVGLDGGVYGTIDGGLTWNILNLPGNQCYNKGLYFFDEENGFVGGSGCFQGELISYVANENWLTGTWNLAIFNAPTGMPENNVTDIDFYDNNFGLAVSKSGYVFRTTNAGLNWDSVHTPHPLNQLTSIKIVNDTLAYVGYETTGSGFGLYVTTDAGLSWNFDGNSATFYYPNFYTLHQSGNGMLFTGGYSQTATDGVIFSSEGDFTLWNIDVVDQTIYDMASYNDSIVFAVGDSGYIVVNHPQLLTGIKQIMPSDLISNVFPNPAHDKLYFNTSQLIQTTTIKYVIYSSIGQIVKSGVLQNAIDISELNAGIYFVEVSEKNRHQQYKIIID